jgi:hypothetical protein
MWVPPHPFSVGDLGIARCLNRGTLTDPSLPSGAARSEESIEACG